jgi:Fungal specific transcription factor domain
MFTMCQIQSAMRTTAGWKTLKVRNRCQTSLTITDDDDRPSNRIQVDALTDRVNVLEHLLMMANGGSAYQGEAPQPTFESASSEDNEHEMVFEDISYVNDMPLPTGQSDGIFEWSPDQKNTKPTARDIKRRKSVIESETLSNAVSPSSVCISESPELKDHLLDMYFQHFQILLKIVDEETFRAAANPQESLMLAMLAAGARFSNDPRLAGHYTTRNGESVFMRRSKALLESEVQHADITTVQALLILGELETSVGNEMSGCMYSGKLSSKGSG